MRKLSFMRFVSGVVLAGLLGLLAGCKGVANLAGTPGTSSQAAATGITAAAIDAALSGDTLQLTSQLQSLSSSLSVATQSSSNVALMGTVASVNSNVLTVKEPSPLFPPQNFSSVLFQSSYPPIESGGANINVSVVANTRLIGLSNILQLSVGEGVLIIGSRTTGNFSMTASSIIVGNGTQNRQVAPAASQPKALILKGSQPKPLQSGPQTVQAPLAFSGTRTLGAIDFQSEPFDATAQAVSFLLSGNPFEPAAGGALLTYLTLGCGKLEAQIEVKGTLGDNSYWPMLVSASPSELLSGQNNQVSLLLTSLSPSGSDPISSSGYSYIEGSGFTAGTSYILTSNGTCPGLRDANYELGGFSFGALIENATTAPAPLSGQSISVPSTSQATIGLSDILAAFGLDLPGCESLPPGAGITVGGIDPCAIAAIGFGQNVTITGAYINTIIEVSGATPSSLPVSIGGGNGNNSTPILASLTPTASAVVMSLSHLSYVPIFEGSLNFVVIAAGKVFYTSPNLISGPPINLALSPSPPTISLDLSVSQLPVNIVINGSRKQTR